MRYFGFAIKTNAEQIRENAKINLREYAYENPIAAMNMLLRPEEGIIVPIG